MSTLQVLGLGLFAPGFGSVAAYFAGEADAAVTEPAAPHLQGRVRRFTSLVTRMAADVAGQALEQAGLEPKSVRSVFGAARGESQTALALLELRERGAASSAARFTQSVHSAPSGVWSLAVGNLCPTTTVAAGAETFAAAWLEATGLLHEAPDPLLVVLADEPVPEALSGLPEDALLAIAFVLAGARYRGPRPALARVAGNPARTSDGNPVAAALPLLRAVHEKRWSEAVRAPLPPVEALVPHRPPMLWLDALVDGGEAFAASVVEVKASSELLDGDALPATVALEWMAQTAAAHRALSNARAPRRGALAGVREARFVVARFPLGAILTVHAEVQWTDGRAATYRCRVESEGSVVASAHLVVVDA